MGMEDRPVMVETGVGGGVLEVLLERFPTADRKKIRAGAPEAPRGA